MSIPDYDTIIKNQVVCLICIGSNRDGKFVHAESLLDILNNDNLEVWFVFSDKEVVKLYRKDFDSLINFCFAVRDFCFEIQSSRALGVVFAAIEPDKLFRTMMYWAHLGDGSNICDHIFIHDVVNIIYGPHAYRILTMQERSNAFNACAKLGLNNQEVLTGDENIDSIISLIIRFLKRSAKNE
jgi:hypothetical protein